MHRVLVRLVPTVLAAAAVALPTGAARAANAFDIYALQSPSRHITSGSCRNIPVTAKTDAGAEVANLDAQVEVWRGTVPYGGIDLTPVSGDVQNLHGNFYFCPHRDEPSTYRLGPTGVTWWDQSNASSSFTDDSTASVIVMQASQAGFGGTRTYAVRTFTARPLFYYCGWNPNIHAPDGWYIHPPGTKVKLQYRAANNTGSWTWVASARTGPRGRVSFTIRAAHKYQYRVVSAATPHTWRTVSRILTL